MITSAGPQVIEFNARFGDPETQVVLPRLQSDLLELCAAVAEARSTTCAAELERRGNLWGRRRLTGLPWLVCHGLPITGLDALDPDIIAFHAGTRPRARWPTRTTGGRVLTLVARGATVAAARAHVYANMARVSFEGAHWRSDIAAREE